MLPAPPVPVEGVGAGVLVLPAGVLLDEVVVDEIDDAELDVVVVEVVAVDVVVVVVAATSVKPLPANVSEVERVKMHWLGAAVVVVKVPVKLVP